MRPTETRTLHFDLKGRPDVPYTVRVAGWSAPLQRHTPDTLAAARAAEPILKLLPDANLTHYVDAVLPSDAMAMIVVTTPRTINGKTVRAAVHLGVHMPQASRARASARIARKPGVVHPLLAFHGVTAEQFAALAGADTDPQLPDVLSATEGPVSAATTLLYCHHDLINLDPDTGSYIVTGAINNALNQTSNDLPQEIYDENDGWLVTTTAPDGSVYHNPSEGVVGAMTASVQIAVQQVKDDLQLQNQQWTLNYGSTSNDYGATASTNPAAEAASDVSGSGNLWTMRNLSPGNGLSVDTSSLSYSPPAASDSWSANGVWSINDPNPLPADIAAQITAGTVTVSITTPTGPIASATLSGTMTAGQATTLTAVFSGSNASSVSGTFSLNSGQTGLSYSLSASNIGTNAGAQIAASVTYNMPFSDTSSMGTLSFSCTNSWLRHLSLFVQYLDAGGNAFTPPSEYPEVLPVWLRTSGTNTPNFEPDATKKFVALLPPVTTVFGVPISPDPTSLTIAMPTNASSVRLLFGGLGRANFDSSVCPIGITLTAFAELALPVVMFAAGSSESGNSTIVNSILADPDVLFAVCAAGAFLFAGGAATYIALSNDPGEAAKSLAEKFGPMLLSPATSLGKWALAQISESAAEDAVPLIDVGLAVVRAATTAADLSQTIIEVLDSPYVYETDIAQSMNLTVELVPDPTGVFPSYHATLRVCVTYDSGTTLPVSEQSFPSTPLPDSITVTFNSVPAGGRLQVFAFFYAANGWQSGQGQSGWLDATSTNGTLTITGLTVIDNLIPLDQNSIYRHIQKIDPAGGDLGWAVSGKPPTSTILSVSPYASQGKGITKLVDITMAQTSQMVGYAWEASGLGLPRDQPGPSDSGDMFTVQTASIGQSPQMGFAAPAVGFTLQSGITFDLGSADDGTGRNFYIDPSLGAYDPVANPDGGYHLRRLALTNSGAPSISTGDSLPSWGRFPDAIDRYVVHPQGYVFGISFGTSKIYRLQLPPLGTLDSSLPDDADATIATLLSGPGTRDGLVSGPVGIAAALDGRILVVETQNMRVQAFDVDGNPVKYFANSTACSFPLNLAGATLLDMSVEARGYIYVLYHTGDGSLASMYFMNIYEPDGTPLVQTPAVAAGCLTVDLQRNMFVLNYETVLDATGRPQPTVSQWMPPPPSPGTVIA